MKKPIRSVAKSLRMRPEIWAACTRLARREGVSLNYYLSYTVEVAVKRALRKK